MKVRRQKVIKKRTDVSQMRIKVLRGFYSKQVMTEGY
jgi:hypothetical protein